MTERRHIHISLFKNSGLNLLAYNNSTLIEVHATMRDGDVWVEWIVAVFLLQQHLIYISPIHMSTSYITSSELRLHSGETII